MKEQIEKQAIEEMAKDICHLTVSCEECTVLARKTGQSKEQYCKAMQYAKRAVGKGYRRQSEWISVDERLPDNHRTVLVACKGITVGGAAPIAVGSYGGGHWFLADAEGTLYLTKYMHIVVTHWMPLPEPPKMKGGAE